jgi:dienelactone hydrolase
MLRLLLFAFFLTLGATLSAQFQVGHTSMTFTDPARNNRPIQVEIYYPADVTGDNVPLSAGQFPVIQFGHGFVMVWSAYQHFWETYVPQGYILCFPKTEGSFSPSHTEFAKDLAFLCTAMEAEKVQPSSLFFGHIQSRYGVMGHSMGGGCSVLAYQYNPDLIQCVATFAAANTNPSAIAVAPAVSVPSLTFAGAEDCIAPPAQQAQLIFEALDTSACKIYVNVNGASHCQFADANTNCNLGEIFSGCANPPITAMEQQQRVNSILLPWLNTYLKESPGFLITLQDTLSAENGFVAVNNCQSVTTVEETAAEELEFNILGNPVLNDELLIQFNQSAPPAQLYFLLYDVAGRLVTRFSGPSSGSNETLRISTAGFSPGMYCLVGLRKDGGRLVRRFILRD